jgi:hypothetical protein
MYAFGDNGGCLGLTKTGKSKFNLKVTLLGLQNLIQKVLQMAFQLPYVDHRFRDCLSIRLGLFLTHLNSTAGDLNFGP